jgi:hypothetical protein
MEGALQASKRITQWNGFVENQKASKLNYQAGNKASDHCRLVRHRIPISNRLDAEKTANTS